MRCVILTRLVRVTTIFLPVIFLGMSLWAQTRPGSKPPIDTSAIRNWSTVNSYGCWISPHGRYMAYINQRSQSGNFVISDTSGVWRKEYPGVYDCYFSGDDKMAVLEQGDSLLFLHPGENKEERIIYGKTSPYVRMTASDGEWFVYQEKGPDGQLVLLNLLNGKEQRFGNVERYMFSKDGHVLLLEQKTGPDSNAVASLQLMELKTDKKTVIWTGQAGEKYSELNFSGDGQQLAFIVASNVGGDKLHSIWNYRAGEGKAILKLREDDPRIAKGSQFAGQLEFTRNGSWLFFILVEPKPVILPTPGPDAVLVEVWSYRDRIIQPAQLPERPGRYRAVLSTEGDHFSPIENSTDELAVYPEVTEDVVVIKHRDSTWWADEEHHFIEPHHYYLRSLRDSSQSFSLKVSGMVDISLSPDGRWIVYYDPMKENYFSYDLISGTLHNLTGGLPTRIISDHPHDLRHWAAASQAGWVKGGNWVLLYDNFDLWQIDFSGKRPPINVTKGYGLSHHVKLRLFEEWDSRINELIFSPGDTLLFAGFNMDNKYNGFLQQTLGSAKAPEVLFMGPYTFYQTISQMPHGYAFDNGMKPVQATKARCWLVKRQSATKAPNIFLTSDLRNYRALTENQPQSTYNWLTAELMNYKQLDGTSAQGVLYKPEDFDPGKKYPVIFNYYEILSHRLYQFPKPELMQGNIDVPWFVSRGYLVFTPDINITPANKSGKTVGEYASNSIVAAAQYLGTLPFVDKKHMGIQGHSFGAQQTNYLVTHTHLFAAASEMAGVSDEISSYLSLLPAGVAGQEIGEDIYIKEAGQIRLGATLWKHPEFYLRESAVLYADRVTTPLLIVHDRKDNAVSWKQGLEFYLALRRLGKKVWMLQYDEGTHGLINEKDQLDYTIRVTQFFDHYLKGALPPKWLTEGIPAKMKGLKTGYELDNSGKKP